VTDARYDVQTAVKHNGAEAPFVQPLTHQRLMSEPQKGIEPLTAGLNIGADCIASPLSPHGSHDGHDAQGVSDGAESRPVRQTLRRTTPRASVAPTRPTLRYHGGKWLLAPFVIAHMPPHRIYCEPFGGAASVLMRKPRSYGEVYNDLDDMVVTYFRVLRDPASAAELERRVRLTPFSRSEFTWSYGAPRDDIDQAHRLVVRSFMGFGSAAMTSTHVTGFRSNTHRSGTTPARDWVTWPEQVIAFTERLLGVVIENRPAADVMAQHDGLLTLHYVDPPYPHSTRSSMRNGTRPGVKHAYRHEMDDAAHCALAKQLCGLTGMVLLSGYRCAMYDEMYGDWTRIDRATFADGARPRTESLWLNPAAVASLRNVQMTLGEGGGL
jgi:DNA adenine methylase